MKKTYTFQYVRRRNHIGGDFTTKFVKKRSGVFVPNKRWYVGQSVERKLMFGGTVTYIVALVERNWVYVKAEDRWFSKSILTPLNPGR